MTLLSVYVPRDSVLHRMPAGVKLGALAAACVGILFLGEPWQMGVTLAVVAALYGLASIPWRTSWSQLRKLAIFAAGLFAFQWVVAGWEKAVMVVGGLVVVVLLASLVSLTTRTTDIVDVVVRVAGPFQRVGVDPERLGLFVALGIRSVAVILDLSRDVRDAQLARGLTASPTAFVVPLVVRTLQHADRLADALIARGIDD